MKLKKQKEYTLTSAIKDDVNGIIGTFILSKTRNLKNPFKKRWNKVEQIFWTKELGYSVLTLDDVNNPKISRFVELYPPKVWDKIVILKPKWKYTEKQIVELHNSIKLRVAHNGYNGLNCFSSAVLNHKVAGDFRADRKDVFEDCINYENASIKDFTQNRNLQPIQLQGKKSEI